MASNDYLIKRCKDRIDLPVYLIHKDYGPCVMKSCGEGAIYVVLDKDGRTIGCRFPYSITVGELQLDVKKDKEIKEKRLKEK